MRDYYYGRELSITNSVLGNVINDKSWKKRKEGRSQCKYTDYTARDTKAMRHRYKNVQCCIICNAEYWQQHK